MAKCQFCGVETTEYVGDLPTCGACQERAIEGEIVTQSETRAVEPGGVASNGSYGPTRPNGE